MGIILKTLVSIVAVASLASTAALPADTKQLTTRDACSSGLYASTLTIGGKGGDDFCESRIGSSGEVISGLDVWSDGTGIKGILFTYSGGQAMMHGAKVGDNKKNIKFAAGEKVVSATLWGDGQGRYLGHIYLKTDKQEFDIGKGKANKGYEIDVGGGLLLGASGAAGTKIDRLALLFLSPKISSVSIGDIKFDSDPSGTSDNMAPSYLIQSTMGNPSGSNGNVSFTISGSEGVTKSTIWEQSSTNAFGGSISIEISGQVAGIGAKASGGFEWSTEDSTSKTNTITDTVTLTQTVGPISIAPGHGKACKLFAQKGDGNFPYTSTVTLKLDNGKSISYQEKGKLISVQFSKVQASCIDADDPKGWDSTTDNPPAGVKIVGKSSSR
ncbi:MAG: hypothetical protein L6R39_002852 [Caloplaca ligustica]|nr:MAG: hypothetical protein L6R39_002852 [Caloplaca ligustica]